MRFESYEWLSALWALPVLGAIVVFALVRGRTLLQRFVEHGLLPSMAGSRSSARRVVKWSIALSGLGFAIVALARPQWNPQPQEIQQRGRDVVFLIDVSRSMLAEDLAPNRLERAKLWVRDTLKVMRGDRVAIVPFAGTAVVKCPLTHDYGFARMALDDLSPSSVARGGTLIGDAVRLTLSEVFDTQEASFKDIILITDGEDQESFPVDAAKAAGDAGVRIIAVGIGDETQGKPIPITDARGRQTFLTFNGEQVLSRLDGQTLREMATASNGGSYLPVGTGTIELDRMYEKLVRQAEQRELASAEAVQYEEKFQIFLALAVGLLLLELLIKERRNA